MALVLTIKEIIEHLEQLGLWNPATERTVVYAQVNPSMGQFFLFGAYAQLIKGKYFVMCLEENRVILIPLSKLSGKIDKKLEPIFIPHEELEGVYIKRGKMMHTVIFIGEEEELPLNLSKVAVGMKWHKNNLETVMTELEALQGVVGTGEI